MNDECFEVIKKVIEYKNQFPFSSNNNFPRNRHCSQENFKFINVGGKCKQDVINSFTIDGSHFLSVSSLPMTNYGRYTSNIVCITDETYVFGGYNDRIDPVIPVEKYSPDITTWAVITRCMIIVKAFVRVRLLIVFMSLAFALFLIQ